MSRCRCNPLFRAILFCAATLSLSAATIATGTIVLDGTEPITGPNRVIRNSVVSTFASPKAFPGQSSCLGNCVMRTLTITPANPSVTVKLTGLANGGNVFALAYLNSFNPSALSVNYLGDGGASTPLAAVISFQVTVPAGNQLVLVVMDNISGFFGGVSYEISIPDVTPPPTGVPISPITLTAITVLLAASAAFAMRKSYC